MTATSICFLIILIGFFFIGVLAYKGAKHLKVNNDIFYKEYLQRKGK